MITMSSMLVLAAALVAIVLPNLGFCWSGREMSEKWHRICCVIVFALGCFARFYRLSDLPEGVFAEEALLGIQAKSLWQTGGFLFDGGLTAQFAQWGGESTGPLLATITAPFVGVFGMNPLVVRLPLTLLSCGAMAAAYGLGRELSGRRAGFWCLAAYALCPYFVLMARMACGANAAVFLLPIALYSMLKGMKRPAMLYVGMVLTALMAYAQNMYFFLAPIYIVIGGMFSAANGMKKRHVFAAVGSGLMICLPALMTLWVNLSGGEGFTWLGIVQIPRLERFDKATTLFDAIAGKEAGIEIQDKIWAVLVGAFFQILVHMNISSELFAPTGMGALYVLSIPLMLLGGMEVINHIFNGRGGRYKKHAGRMLVIVSFAVTLLMLVVFGSVGLLNTEGASSVFDYSSLLLFDVLLMTAGLRRMEKKSRIGISVLAMLFSFCFVMLCTHLFGGGYQNNANVFFGGFAELSKKAAQVQSENGAKVNVTGNVYPHIAPSDAAEMMYLYATDADLKEKKVLRGEDYDIIYAPGIEMPDPEEIYMIAQNDFVQWDFEAFHYEENGEYILLTPIAK